METNTLHQSKPQMGFKEIFNLETSYLFQSASRNKRERLKKKRTKSTQFLKWQNEIEVSMETTECFTITVYGVESASIARIQSIFF